MTRLAAIVGISALFLALTSGAARADYVAAGGISCQATGGSLTTNLSASAYGLQNYSNTTDVYVSCPLNVGRSTSGSLPITNVIVRYQDGSSTAAMMCRVYRTGYDGSQAYSTYKYSCATGGGCTTLYSCNTSNGTCTDVVSSYGGRNYLSWTTSELGFNASYVDSQLMVQCLLPRCSGTSCSGTSASGIISYFVQ
jgi:hypothetical protein